jgi:hypothetical protein
MVATIFMNEPSCNSFTVIFLRAPKPLLPQTEATRAVASPLDGSLMVCLAVENVACSLPPPLMKLVESTRDIIQAGEIITYCMHATSTSF